MIDVARTKAALAELPGETVGLNKAHVAQLLDELESGQKALRALGDIRSVVFISAMAGGVPA